MNNETSTKGDIAREYPDYLRDESRKTGEADSISFPRSEDEVRALLRLASQQRQPVTTQGARTGITAGAVPHGGHILNLSRMNRFLGLRRRPGTPDFLLRLQPGVLLTEVAAALARRDFDLPADSAQTLAEFRAAGAYQFTPDPTEASASIGGMVACNASGARSFLYGPTRDYVESLRVALPDGDVLRLQRGGPRATGRSFSVQTDTGRVLNGEVPAYTMPEVKNASGYFAQDDMDLIDLFIGSEGTLGVITEIEIRLIPTPAARCGVMAFFPAEPAAVAFVKRVRSNPPRPAAVEFFDRDALRLLREQKKIRAAFSEVPDMPDRWHTAVYVEYHGPSPAAVEEAVMGMSESMTACGGDADATWMADDDGAIDRMKAFRHAVPEAVNLLIDERRRREPGLTKLGTDLAVPDAHLDAVLAMYRRGLSESGLESVVFGHIGNNHVHVNIIPATLADYERGRALYLGWAREVLAMGGTVSAEHGIGKLKTALLREMYGAQGVREMQRVKRLFDPQWILNVGNLFGAEPGARE